MIADFIAVYPPEEYLKQRTAPFAMHFRPKGFKYEQAYKYVKKSKQIKRLTLGCFDRSKYQCQVPECGFKAEPNKHDKSLRKQLRVDDVYEYDFENHTRKLLTQRTVCLKCYDAIHIDRKDPKYRAPVLEHLRDILGWDLTRVELEMDEAYRVQKEIENRIQDWKEDCTSLTNHFVEHRPRKSNRRKESQK